MEALEFPNRLRRARNYSPYSLDTCVPRTFIRGGPEHHLPSVTSRPSQKANSRGTDLFLYRIVAGSPILRTFSASLKAPTPVPQRPGDRKPAGARTPRAEQRPTAPPALGPLPCRARGALTLERADEGLSVLDELLDEFVGLVQLRFV